MKLLRYPLPGEEWRFIDGNQYGIKDYYRISNFGRLWSDKKKIFIKTSINNWGYEQAKLQRNDGTGKSKSIIIHRIVAEHFIFDRQPHQNIVNHKNGIKTNNHYDNLEWSDTYENTMHALYTGLITNRGSNAFKNKYPESMIHDICRLLSTGVKKPLKIIGLLRLTDNYDKKKMQKLIKNLKQRRVWIDVTTQYDY